MSKNYLQGSEISLKGGWQYPLIPWICDHGHIIVKAFKKWPLWHTTVIGRRKYSKVVGVDFDFNTILLVDDLWARNQFGEWSNQAVWVEQRFQIFQSSPSPLRGRTLSCAFESLFFHLEAFYTCLAVTKNSGKPTEQDKQKPTIKSQQKITSPRSCESTHPLQAVNGVLCLRYLGVDSWAFAIVDYKFYTKMGSPRMRGQVSLLLHIPCWGLTIVFVNEASW